MESRFFVFIQGSFFELFCCFWFDLIIKGEKLQDKKCNSLFMNFYMLSIHETDAVLGYNQKKYTLSQLKRNATGG